MILLELTLFWTCLVVEIYLLILQLRLICLELKTINFGTNLVLPLYDLTANVGVLAVLFRQLKLILCKIILTLTIHSDSATVQGLGSQKILNFRKNSSIQIYRFKNLMDGN